MIKRLYLASPSAYLYLLGTFISNLGDGIFTLIISKVLYDKTGSVFAFGLVLIIQNLASFLLNLVAGYVADIKRPQLISEIADSLRGIILILGVIFLGSSDIVVILMVLMILLNLIMPFFRAANFKIVASIQRGQLRLLSLNGLRSSVNQSGQLLGVALATPLIALNLTKMALIIDAITFLSSFVCTVFLKFRKEEQVKAKNRLGLKQLYTDWFQLLRSLFLSKKMFLLVFFASIDSVIVAFINLMEIKYATVVLKNSVYLTVLDGAFALGAMLNFTIIYLIFEKFTFAKISWLGLFFQALGFIGLTLTTSVYVATLFMFVIGVFNGASQSLFQTQLHVSFANEMKGKISSLRDAMVSLLNIIMIPIFSRLLNLNLKLGFIIFSISIIIICIAIFFIFNKRNYRESEL